MSTYDQPISAAQATLDTHVKVRKALEVANHAVLEAIKVAAAFDDPNIGHIFGADADLLKSIAATSMSRLLPLIMAPIPFFSLRIATEEFKSAMESERAEDAALMTLLKSFGAELPITSL